MKFTLSWLKDYLETDATAEEIYAKLNQIGLEVESFENKAAIYAPFKVAQIIEAQKHPEADKLKLCTVDTGSDILQIVCGAPNARSGLKVVLAPVGTVIPANQMVIKPSKIRGVESNGMLCSATELQIGEDSDGIIEILEEVEVGSSFAEIFGLNDPIFEINLTPNRGDCTGVYGIARDLAASGMGKLKEIKYSEVASKFKSPINLTIDNTDKCPVFFGRYFKNVKNTQSPAWLQNRLKNIGEKPISALVDISNYVSFSFGAPKHIYDADKLNGNLKVRGGLAGEKLLGLDQKFYDLDETTIVIADDKEALCIGGIMGGVESSCTNSTINAFVESAYFDASTIGVTGRKLGINSQSRYRNERKINPNFVKESIEVTCSLIQEICGGEASEVVTAGSAPNVEKTIEFDFARVKSLGGIDISKADSIKILENLGFKVTDNGAKLSINTPSWRQDIEGSADIVEEVVRIYGLDNLKSCPLPTSPLLQNALDPSKKRASIIRRALSSRGLNETLSFGFMNSKYLADFTDSGAKPVRIKNPISRELDVMKTCLFPNMLLALKNNEARGFYDLSIFEIANIYLGSEPTDQKPMVGGLRKGLVADKNIYGTSRAFDVFDAKADIFACIQECGFDPEKLMPLEGAKPYYHPGRSATLSLGKNVIGYFGEIHPEIINKFDIRGPIVGFELFIENLPVSKSKRGFKGALAISQLQSSTRDFAFVMDKTVTAAKILQNLKQADKELVKKVEIFDVYEGEHVEAGKKSVAIRILIQPTDKTLSEVELDAISNKIIFAIEAMGGKLR